MHIDGKISYNELEQLIYILKENLVNSYLKKIYHYEGLWMFKFNHMSFVYDHGNCIWIGKFNERETKLHSISIKLRKEIGDRKLINIDIVDNDRTIVLEFRDYKLVFEVYAKGNIILLNKENKIIVLTRLYHNCYHNMIYKLADFKKFDNYEILKFGWKINNKEVIENGIDFENISEALLYLWNLKYKKKEIKIINNKKKKTSVKYHIDNQIKNFNKKIDKKMKQIGNLEDVSYDSIDYKELEKLYTQKKKLDNKLKKASKIVICDKTKGKAKNKNIKIELVTTNWYQKYHWWYTKNGFLVVGGKNADDNEKIVKTYLKDTDYYLHTDEAGSGSFVLITEKRTPEDIDFTETAEGVLALSTQWNSSFISGKVYYVKGEQVSKTPNSGEYVTKGSFIIRGNKNYINISECTLGYGLYNNNQLMLAPYGIINRLKGSKVKIIHSTKKMKGKIMSKFIKKKLNIKLPDSISLFSKPCKIK